MAQPVKKQYGRYYEIDGLKLPSVTSILSSIAKPALINWASYGARDATIAAARNVYSVANNGITPASFEAALRQALGKRPAHLAQSDAAIDVGTLVHARVEAEMRRELGQDVALPEIPGEELVDGRVQPHPAWNAYQAYLAWRREYAVRPVEVEKRVYSKALGFAGTTDFLGYVADQPTIADYKTSKAVYGEYRLQIAAYRAAYCEMKGADGKLYTVQPLGGLILRFPKEAGDTFEPHDVPWAEQDALMTVFLAAKEIFEWQAAA